MDWNKEKEQLEQQIESHIDLWWEEIEFAKSLLVILREAPTKEAFTSGAASEARGCCDTWIRDDLCSFVENLEYC